MYQTQYNPYQQYNQYGNYQQQFQPQFAQQNAINGRYVDSFDSITANEVSMDGKPSLFIKSDLSEIQARMWNANGTISNFVFKPTLDEKGINSQQNENNGYMERLDTLESKLFERLDAIESRLPKSRVKKEVVADESI